MPFLRMAGEAYRAILILWLLFSIGCAWAPPPEPAAVFRVSGETRFSGEPLGPDGGDILLFPESPVTEPFTSEIRPDGTFRATVPGGTYYVMGRSRSRTGEPLFAFWGRNPVYVSGPLQEGIVLVFTRSTDPPRSSGGSGITGRVMLDGRPLDGAVVAAYLDAKTGFHGPPYAASRPSDGQGRYHLPVEPGTYYLVARHRSTGGALEGPLLKGDQVGYYLHNPVTLRSGNGLEIDMGLVEVNRPRGGGSLSPGKSIIVTGRVLMEGGRPPGGVRVVLYDTIEMLGRPVFISSPADREGRYRLEVAREGVYFPAARSVIGGPPRTGELLGFYEGSEDRSIDLRGRDGLDGVDITVREMW